jgi:hypothetical protein
VELQYDSYRGPAARCRYLLRVTVTGKGMAPDSRRDFPVWVTNYEEASEPGPPIKARRLLKCTVSSRCKRINAETVDVPQRTDSLREV